MALTKIDDRGLKTPIDLLDNEKIRFGTGNDLEVFHNGTDSFVKNTTGQLCLNSDEFGVANAAYTENIIRGTVNSDVELYYDGVKQINTTSTGVTLNDNKRIDFGTGADLRIYHESSSTTNWLEATNGDTKIQCTDGDIYLNPKAGEVGVKVITDGAVELYHNNVKKVETTSDGTSITGNLTITSTAPYIQFTDSDSNPDWLLQNSNGAFVFHDGTASRLQLSTTGNVQIPVDSGKLQLGASQDLQIYHDGTQNLIEGTAPLYIKGSPVVLYKGGTTEKFFEGVADAEVKLYYDGTKKFETSSAGVKITGELEFLTASDVNFTGSNYHAVWDASASALELKDSTKLIFGTGDDLQIYHDATNNWIKSSTGQLKLETTDSIQFFGNNSETLAQFSKDGACYLYHNNSQKFETTSDGIKLSGNGYADFPDNGRIRMGADYDLAIYHSGSHGYILNGTGNFDIRSGEVGFYNHAGGETLAKFTADAGVDLYHNNSKVFETLGNGVRAQGGIMFGSDTADANRITDYEEGTFTPTIGTSSGSAALRAANNTLSYTKIGNTVHINGQIVFDAPSSPGGAFWLIGLPFTCGDGTELSKRSLSVGLGWFNGSGISGDDHRLWASWIAEGSVNFNNIEVLHDSHTPDSTSADLIGDGTDLWFEFSYKTA